MTVLISTFIRFPGGTVGDLYTPINVHRPLQIHGQLLVLLRVDRTMGHELIMIVLLCWELQLERQYIGRRCGTLTDTQHGSTLVILNNLVTNQLTLVEQRFV